MELALLLEDPSDVEDPSFSLWDDRLVLRPRRKRKQITDIVAWVQAFGIYTLVMCSRCSSSYQLCRFRHTCDFPGCTAVHRRSLIHAPREVVALGRCSTLPLILG